jgi:cytochrome c5
MSNRTLSIALAMLPALAIASAAPAQEDVRKVKLSQEGLKVIEEKCLVCHNRQRIDAAIKERKDVERVIRQMEKQGVVVTEKERQVIGHFWQQKVFKPQGDEAKPKP